MTKAYRTEPNNEVPRVFTDKDVKYLCENKPQLWWPRKGEVVVISSPEMIFTDVGTIVVVRQPTFYPEKDIYYYAPLSELRAIHSETYPPKDDVIEPPYEPHWNESKQKYV